MFFLLLFILGHTLLALNLSLDSGLAPSFNIAAFPAKNASVNIAQIIQNDLKSTTYFNIHNTTLESLLFPNSPNFNLWINNKTHYLVSCSLSDNGQKNATISYKVWDIFSRQTLFSGSLQTEPKFLRRTAHIIADRIHEQVTGLPSCFDTQIVFVHETHEKNKTTKQLAIMDQDGHNMKILTPPYAHILAPTFAPDPRYICFTYFKKGIATAHILDLKTGKITFLEKFEGLSYAPRFSPDGKLLIFSGAQSAASNLYTYDINTKKISRLTNNDLTETSPCYSPDGKRIVFTAGKNSTPHLYVMDANGQNRIQITFSKGGYSAPSWSPDGKYITFVKQYKGVFYLGIIHPDGSEERLLTEGFLIEGPQWAPNSQSIVFGRKERAKPNFPSPSKICTIDLSGHNERTLKNIQAGSDPCWSSALRTKKGN